ncbi:MAG: iron chelate uptake ABC transporter family permease subunit [Kiritimatiellia bacterium]|jgi:iron complex transport system permease protein
MSPAPESPTTTTPAIAVRKLAFGWRGADAPTVFQNLSFDIAPGEHVALVGPNGAGKSTALRCIAGLLKPLAGSVLLHGIDTATLSRRELARQIAFLPQSQGLESAMTVRELVMTGRYPYFTLFEPASAADRQAVADALALTGTAAFADRRFDTLSGGERQRTLLAAAIAQEAPVLLLDEPFTFLDPAGQEAFAAVIRRLRSHRGVTVVTVTHDLVRARADDCRILGLGGGRLVLDGPADEAMTPDALAALFGCPIALPPATPAAAPSRGSVETLPPPPPLDAPVAASERCCRIALTALALAGVFALATAAAALIGSPLKTLLNELFNDPTGTEANLFLNFRLPRCVMAFLAGSSLALAGLVFQALFRNPLATPYTLGVSGGASLGAVVAMQFGLAGAFSQTVSVQTGAFLGALLSIAIVYGTFRLKRRADATTLLLAGVACSFLFSSLIMLLQYVSDPANTINTLHWMMGGVFVTGFEDALRIAPALAIGLATALPLTRELDILTLGDEHAGARGVSIERVRTALFFAVSLMTAAVVSQCGPIGFVGMMVPHVCRLALGPLHRRLVPASLAAGGVFLLACDTVARTLVSPAEIPVGVITSLCGAPFLLYLLASRRR